MIYKVLGYLAITAVFFAGNTVTTTVIVSSFF